MIDKQLFDRFLKNECNADEQRLVREYLDAHPDEAGQSLNPELSLPVHLFRIAGTTMIDLVRLETNKQHALKTLKGHEDTTIHFHQNGRDTYLPRTQIPASKPQHLRLMD
jgi:hypothetical protein